MPDPLQKQLRELLGIQLMAMGALQLQMAAALIGKGQDELRNHFAQSAELMLRASKEMSNG
jgi:uncharacterized membrane-anchored protein YhcB (DUF1043 family)